MSTPATAKELADRYTVPQLVEIAANMRLKTISELMRLKEPELADLVAKEEIKGHKAEDFLGTMSTTPAPPPAPPTPKVIPATKRPPKPKVDSIVPAPVLVEAPQEESPSRESFLEQFNRGRKLARGFRKK